jgi:nitrite reductase (NO-forming)
MKRSDFFKWMGIGGAGLSLGYLTKSFQSKSKDEICNPVYTTQNNYNFEGRPSGMIHNSYGGMYHTPITIKENYGDRFYFPPNYQNENFNNLNINLYQMNLQISNGITYPAWTFNGIVPGPIIRTKRNKSLKIHFQNSTLEPHSFHIHGNHDPLHDGWESIPQGQSKLYEIEPDPSGILPYHCHVPPLPIHISKGLYGAMIVDPLIPRKKAHEYILIISGWDLEGKGKNDLYTWNGMAGFYDRYPIKVPIGELIRFYIVNMIEFDPVMTFHLHSKTFDIYRSGSDQIFDHSDVVTLSQTERVIIEFTLTKKGRYMFHPHQSKMAENGAMGWIVGI